VKAKPKPATTGKVPVGTPKPVVKPKAKAAVKAPTTGKVAVEPAAKPVPVAKPKAKPVPVPKKPVPKKKAAPKKKPPKPSIPVAVKPKPATGVGKSAVPWSRLGRAQKEFLADLVASARAGKMIRIYYTPKVTTGKPVYRTILPFSVRMRNVHVNGYDQPSVPTVVLFGYDVYDTEGATIKMFVVDRIKNATFGKRTLTNPPAWPIEFESLQEAVHYPAFGHGPMDELWAYVGGRLWSVGRKDLAEADSQNLEIPDLWRFIDRTDDYPDEAWVAHGSEAIRGTYGSYEKGRGVLTIHVNYISQIIPEDILRRLHDLFGYPRRTIVFSDNGHYEMQVDESTSVEKIVADLVEITTSGNVAGYDIPLGAKPYWMKQKKKKKKKKCKDGNSVPGIIRAKLSV